jgi:hypothetical protein
VVEMSQIVRCQRHVERGDVLLKPFDPLGAWDRNDRKAWNRVAGTFLLYSLFDPFEFRF